MLGSLPVFFHIPRDSEKWAPVEGNSSGQEVHQEAVPQKNAQVEILDRTKGDNLCGSPYILFHFDPTQQTLNSQTTKRSKISKGRRSQLHIAQPMDCPHVPSARVLGLVYLAKGAANENVDHLRQQRKVNQTVKHLDI